MVLTQGFKTETPLLFNNTTRGSQHCQTVSFVELFAQGRKIPLWCSSPEMKTNGLDLILQCPKLQSSRRPHYVYLLYLYV